MKPGPKVPGKISPTSLERSARFHLERRALTEAQLRRSLGQKVRRAERHHGPCPEASAWIDDVIARCLRAGLLDDRKVATGRALSLRERGASRRGVLQKLRHKGVDAETAAQVLAAVDEIVEIGVIGDGDEPGDAELQAARAYARRRKLATKDPQKALAALARQGFSFDVARRALAAAAAED